ncbi:MAG: TM0106 family RecB-like putative nuclease [Gemmatimonadales bacterium]|nr:TM0106 family RecB-like putative nuclease [Gemmatimonadales bacterium]NIN13216.1 TM0106 family RecB-like putative nuclease [Gemmatimonadales bacterium]NIN51233.1 TM0106 family RecB-like putative nuclease [Gemmatimonadales bacterium]NIP08697.1 TM0106 family RecB-like putative nuclease [Gemmatimonadales bacterium]NIR00950.1 TM0106 family RecB-like putative nuclease [Gemmatimonadales bacterium]
MHLSASDIYTHHRPSRCDLRIYLLHHGELEGRHSEYEEVLIRLGERHERAHLQSLTDVVLLDFGSREQRERLTRQAVADEQEVIYQPAFRSSLEIDGKRWEVVGDPDFLIRWGDGYIIRDCKIARRITHADHPEIHFQMELYGWLYERTFGEPPKTLEVYAGNGEIAELGYRGGTAALQELELIARIKLAEAEPYSPVGWSKCQDCGFHYLCWPRAEQRKDVALVYGVDQWIVHELRNEGIESYPALLERLDVAQLAEITKPSSKHTGKVGKRAPSIMRMAEALARDEEILIEPPSVPEHPNYVMFDLEGLPPQLEHDAIIYLWGMQVFGERPGKFSYALADFSSEGDKNGWLEFLRIAQQIFDEYGDLPFVHWYSYEKTNVEMYVERYGDPDGVAARVLGSLLDLLPVTQASIALPLYSYSLKEVERHIGYERKLTDTGGDWAMARYNEALETDDEGERDAIMQRIVSYNQEDLAAMWQVMAWLKGKAAGAAAEGRANLRVT